MLQWAKITEGIYFASPNEFLVNLYVSSTVSWERSDATVVIQQTSELPNKAAVSFAVADIVPRKAVERGGDDVSVFDFLLHVPYWAIGNMTVTVNGVVHAFEDSQAPRWYRLPGKWQKGDSVGLQLPISIHAAPIGDDSTVNAIMYGPLVLVGLTNSTAAFTVAPSQVGGCFQADPSSLTFRSLPNCMLGGASLRFKPLFAVVNENYGMYWQFLW